VISYHYDLKWRNIMFKPGDRVRVVNRDEWHFDDYVVGDEAIVEYVWRSGTLRVNWATNLSNVRNEGPRVAVLFAEEVELVS